MSNFRLPYAVPDEKIILLLRRHWFIILTKLLFWMVTALLPLLFFFILPATIKEFLFNSAIYPIFVLFTAIYYLYIWLFAFHSFVDYYLDVWIVTNKRIINIEQKGLFVREVSEQKLFRIQDVTSELKGMFSTLIDYGTVYIQTAGEQARFTFKQVPQPNQTAQKIIQMAEHEKHYQRLLDQGKKINTGK